jgi:molybdopterin-containing oxidoreductase family membrane subunit
MTVFGLLLPEKKRLAEVFGAIARGRGGVLLYAAIAAMLLGGAGIVAIFSLGHGRTTNTSTLVPWGMQIATYVFFALVSGGCIFTNFLGNQFFRRSYEPLATRVIFLGLVTALAGFISLASELGHLERMFWFLLSPNPTSPMFWMSVWYTADIAILLVEYYNVRRHHHSKGLLYASFVIPVITYCSLGSLFGAVSSLPYYYSALLPIYFIFTGFLAGNALCALVAALQSRTAGGRELLRPFIRMQKVALASVFVLTFCRTVIGLAGSGSGYEIFRETLLHDIFFGLLLSLVVPFLILTWRKSAVGVTLAALVVLATQFVSRVELVVRGFRVPLFRVYDMPERVGYFPSIPELLVLVASAGTVLFCYLVAEKSGLFEKTQGEG